MNGYINLHRVDTITIANKEDRVYIVISNGRHRLGISRASLADAEEMLRDMEDCVKFSSGFYRINQEIEEVRSYKNGRED